MNDNSHTVHINMHALQSYSLNYMELLTAVDFQWRGPYFYVTREMCGVGWSVCRAK